MKKGDAIKLAIRALTENTKVGQQGITKHDILVMMQSLDTSVKDGYVVGRAISHLINEGYLKQTGKKGNANVYERKK